MRKDLGSKPYLFPQPVLIIGTYDENGIPNAMNAAWGGIADTDEILICLSEHKTTSNIKLKKAFTVSMGTVEQVVPCDYVGIVSGNKEGDKVKKAGFTAIKSGIVDAPLFAELPVALECELIEIIGTEKYLGRIKNVSVDESVLTDGDVDITKFHPIIYETARHGYHALGERIADAFKVGSKLK